MAAPEAEAESTPEAEAESIKPPEGRVLKKGAVVVPEPSDATVDFLKVQPEKSLLLNSTHFLHTREHEEFYRNMLKENAGLTTDLAAAELKIEKLHPDPSFWDSKAGLSFKIGGVTVTLVGCVGLGFWLGRESRK